MSLLGGRFKWITQLEYSGTIDETGTLNGNLFVIGSGDPSKQEKQLVLFSNYQDYLAKISEAGIKKINEIL